MKFPSLRYSAYFEGFATLVSGREKTRDLDGDIGIVDGYLDEMSQEFSKWLVSRLQVITPIYPIYK